MRNDKATTRDFCAVVACVLQQMEKNAATNFVVRQVIRAAIDRSNPERKGNSSKDNCQFISVAAESALSTGANMNDMEADHAFPVSLVVNEVYVRKMTDVDDLVHLVSKAHHSKMVLITKEEHRRLNEAGLMKAMPKDWDGEDIFARYKHLGIEVKPKP